MSENKKAGEVVVTISGEEKDVKNAKSVTQSPRISVDSHLENTFFMPSPNRPPKIPNPETLTRRKTLVRSINSKPKSRFGEQPLIDHNMFDEMLEPVGQTLNSPARIASNRASPNVTLLKETTRTISITPKTPLMASPGGAGGVDEDEEIYKKVNIRKKLKYKRVKMKVLLEWIVFLLLLGSLISSLTIDKLKDCKLWNLELWKWLVLIMVIICGMLVTNWLMHFIVLLIELNFLLRKKVLYFVHGLKKSVQVCIWLIVVLVTWTSLFTTQDFEGSKTKSRVLDYFTWTIVSLLVGAILWLLKTLLLKILATSFHVSNFFERIQESIFLQYVLFTLSGPPVMESLQMVGSSASRSHLSFQVKRKGKEAKTKEVIDNVAQPGVTYIEDLDLRRFMIKEEVDVVFPLIDVADKGQIDRKSLTEWVVKVYNGRKALAHALSDTKTAVKQLDKLVTVVLFVIVLVVWLLLTEIATTKVLVLLSSQLVVAAFIFGNTCKTIFEAIVFVFIMHPFDVGDRCVIDGIQLIVEEMNILTTVFLRFDNEKIYYPNSVLSTKPISNFYRSPDMGDNVEFSIDFATPIEKIGLLKDKIKKYLEKNPQMWHPNHNFVVKEIENS
ncbi:hypothetical protein L1987_70395 [Smallanthus sonchifolius]|uniref:Uncharacterized protein n=1 Tax=Smallanthus sonchifolius TaxID=185202 RepID=A0ACB9ANR0_9ASTR|nr:hypothetical protein L1987_70395 [Smallanthus sonchifolius]